MIRRALILLAMAGSLSGQAAGEEPPAEAAPDLNTELRFLVFQQGEESTPDAAAGQALRRGEAMVLLVQVPAAARADGHLLDPQSVTFSWNGEPLDSFVYYHHPLHGLAFVFLDEEAVHATPEGELTATGSLLGREEPSAGWRLPLDLRDIPAPEDEPPAGAGFALIEDEEGEPVAGGRLFGQGVAGIYGVSGADGLVALASESRDLSATLHAWAEGYWPRRTELLHGRRITLREREPEDLRRVDVYLESTLGVTPRLALLDLELGNYTVVEGPGPHRLTLPPDAGAHVTALLPGHQARTVEVPMESDTVHIVLEPIAGLWPGPEGEVSR